MYVKNESIHRNPQSENTGSIEKRAAPCGRRAPFSFGFTICVDFWGVVPFLAVRVSLFVGGQADRARLFQDAPAFELPFLLRCFARADRALVLPTATGHYQGVGVPLLL